MKRPGNLMKAVLTSILFLGGVILAFAQPTGGGPTSPTPFGFVEILIGAGVLYGGRKAYLARKDKNGL